ncbi:MAG: DMT family transporter [Actinobacteria bacterium]|nr:DMT family transporter [Actinomycetota bacterium]
MTASVRTPVPVARARTLGLVALAIAILCFSLGSTMVKKAALPGPTIAFYRMLATTSVWWLILWATERRTISWADLRRTLVPGIAFGVNLVCFFTGVTKTTVANAEFVGSLTPIITVPAGAFLFREHINRKALWFGLVSLAGLMLVLFNAPPRGDASWAGNGIVGCAALLWATYLLSSRRLRNEMSVQSIMASVMTTATLTLLPIALFTHRLDDLTVHSLPYLALLTVVTGTVAHGFIVFSQRTVPVGTISILQVAQPAIAVCWAYLLLDQGIRAIQVLGMALVIGGLLAVVLVTRRTAGKAAETLEPIGPATMCD